MDNMRSLMQIEQEDLIRNAAGMYRVGRGIMRGDIPDTPFEKGLELVEEYEAFFLDPKNFDQYPVIDGAEILKQLEKEASEADFYAFAPKIVWCGRIA